MSEHPDDGVIGGALRKYLGRSWKTTVAGALVIGCAVVRYIPHPVAQAIGDVCREALPIVMGAGLMVAKDGSATHTRP